MYICMYIYIYIYILFFFIYLYSAAAGRPGAPAPLPTPLPPEQISYPVPERPLRRRGTDYISGVLVYGWMEYILSVYRFCIEFSVICNFVSNSSYRILCVQ